MAATKNDALAAFDAFIYRAIQKAQAVLVDRTFGVIEPKREPRPGAEWSGLRSARPRRLLKDTDDDQGTKDY